MKYEAVDTIELRNRLGSQCSPMPYKNGYVIGPDINFRLCHVATCFNMTVARQRADEYNRRNHNGKND